MVSTTKPASAVPEEDDWTTYRFEQFAQNVNERVDDPSQAGVERYVGLEHLDPESLHIRRWGLPTDVEATKLRFWPGDIIFGRRRAYQRKLAVAEFEGICSAHAMVLRAKEDVVLPGFLPFFLQSDVFFERALAISVGSLSPTINWKALAREQFALPPKDEQRRIAEILWAADAAVEQHLQLERELVALMQVYCSTSFFEGSIDLKPLKSLARVKNGATPGRNQSSYWADGTIPWLPSGKIHDRHIVQADELITEQAVKNTSLHLIPSGSVLVAMIGQGKTRGTTAYLAMDACINQNLAAVIPSERADSWYLFYYLSASYDRLRQASQGSNQGALNCRILEQFPVPLVSLDAQRRVGARLRAIDSAKEEVVQHAALLRLMASQIGRKLLTTRSE